MLVDCQHQKLITQNFWETANRKKEEEAEMECDGARTNFIIVFLYLFPGIIVPLWKL